MYKEYCLADMEIRLFSGQLTAKSNEQADGCAGEKRLIFLLFRDGFNLGKPIAFDITRRGRIGVFQDGRGKQFKGLAQWQFWDAVTLNDGRPKVPELQHVLTKQNVDQNFLVDILRSAMGGLTKRTDGIAFGTEAVLAEV